MKYTVDTDELADWVDHLKGFDAKAEHVLADVDALVAKLHLDWEGQAAAAQQQNHERWVGDLKTMREAVVEIQHRAARAHKNYETIVATNQRMWNF
jgi:WXG100 family type VII secretion target